MKAVWLTSPVAAAYTADARPEKRLLACPIASARLRLGVAAHAWREQGNQNLFIEPPALHESGRTDWHDAQVCVVPKYTFDLPLSPWIEACQALKDKGARLVIDICDYPFREKPDTADRFYAWALGAADAVTVNSPRMAEKMAPHFRKPPIVIADAVLDAMGVPRFSPSKRLKLLWFGHHSNLRFLEPCIGELLATGPRPLRLVIVTQDGHGVREAARQIQAAYAPAFEARFVVWSLESTRRELAACDIAILPGVPSDPLKGGVSANRIAEILNAGRFAVASPMHSYLTFENAAWLGQSMVAGIQWGLAHPEEALSRIRNGQALVAATYTMQKLGAQWHRTLHEVIAAS